MPQPHALGRGEIYLFSFCVRNFAVDPNSGLFIDRVAAEHPYQVFAYASQNRMIGKMFLPVLRWHAAGSGEPRLDAGPLRAVRLLDFFRERSDVSDLFRERFLDMGRRRLHQLAFSVPPRNANVLVVADGDGGFSITDNYGSLPFIIEPKMRHADILKFLPT